MVGLTFGEVHFRFPDAVPIGVKEANSPPSSVILNPSDSLIIQPGDQLLVLAEDDDSYSPSHEDDMPSERLLRFDYAISEYTPSAPERLLFVNWRRGGWRGIQDHSIGIRPANLTRWLVWPSLPLTDIVDMITQLDTYVQPGSELTVYSALKQQDMTQRYPIANLMDVSNQMKLLPQR